MCTVSFVVSNDQVIITSNRDESVIRPCAIEPKLYSINGKNVVFPKDPKAGGTWFAITESGTALVLLNGAAEKHQIKKKYRKSRGLILLDVISSEVPIEEWNSIDLKNIEPFTLVLFLNFELYQLRWNEVEKEMIQLDATTHHIWSSSTLYSNEIRSKRAQWFSEFLNKKQQVDGSELFHFHRYTEEKNQDFGLVINRDEALKTLSITQTIITKKEVVLSHVDLRSQKHFVNSYTTR
ncbi:NRDE family protein [Flavobacterium sp.]|uniref:NRDE family protein n=1 Tax=Flavobacterium sp. TaxID=239 RepID=UPI0025BCF8BF|nr:NRDE family protein [Flavobacterium sp.]MBA4154102.1 hypothetical protein [Flavobacterium sp.]